MQISKTAFWTLCLGLFLNASGAVAATDEWQFEVTPYLLAAGMDGTAGVRDHTADVDMSFSDIWNDLEGAFMALFTAQKGPWTLGLEGVYMKLEDDKIRTVTGPGGLISINGELDVTAKLYVFQGTVGYRVLDDTTLVDVLGALRYTKLDLDAKVDVAFAPPIFSGSAGADGSESWTDFAVGARVVHPLSDKVSLLGYADVGAGGSDLTYQLVGGINWEFRKDFVAKLGYRYLSWDYEENGNTWDIAVAGPYLGLGIRF
ncbi:MAG: hypothetical protein KDI63_13190 [Gammaproteobacteria bacterium]|nr:hypothetical protein [Gammaproteobacteria bacterium]